MGLKKLVALLKKDGLLMVRDWPGLAILFIMPAILLIVITFTQESSIPSKRSGMKIAIVNDDSGEFGINVVADLERQGYFNFTPLSSDNEARESVISGKFQMAIIIPEDATDKLFAALSEPEGAKEPDAGRSGVKIIYDPSLQKIFRDAVIMPVNVLLQLSATKVIMTRYTGDVNRMIEEYKDSLASDFSDGTLYSEIPPFPFRQDIINSLNERITEKIKGGAEIELPADPSFSSTLVELTEEPVFRSRHMPVSGLLQNNVPAFTLFAMFFIVIPLAGSIINEKDHGISGRMKTIPVSRLNIALSKIMVFIVVCILQFIFLMFVGKYIMPLLGENSTIDMRVNIPALAAALICSSLAAIGFGIMVGSLSSTHGQAATFGSVMVVILALLGGIFVPVHMLPDVIRKISIISPLRWGTDAFLGVFARHEGISGIWFQLCLLTSFFLVSVLVVVKSLGRE